MVSFPMDFLLNSIKHCISKLFKDKGLPVVIDKVHMEIGPDKYKITIYLSKEEQDTP